ncbi:baseplate hub assembly catalyst [Serratia phage 4S]|nr:baseplate hub assembly catalyst [Serratia phage 4S]
MANILRVKLPEGVQRFKPFTVADYRDLLLIRNDIVSKPEEESQIIDEVLEEFFPEQPKVYRGFIFMNVFTGSIGKTKIPLEYTCPVCEKKHKMLLNLSKPELKEPSIECAGIKLNFKLQDEITEDYDKIFLKAIDSVEYEGQKYSWDELDEDDKNQVIESITYDKFQEILEKLRPIHIERTISCCNQYKLLIDSPISLFKLLLNPDEIFIFYRTNRSLNRAGYSNDDLMKLMPIERNIIIGMIEKEKDV